jgi:transforming growth factor-beta-induced protein
MKAFKIKSQIMTVAVLVGFAVFATSCSQDEDIAPASEEYTLDYKGDKGKGAPSPGDETIVEIALGFNSQTPAEFTQLVAALTYADGAGANLIPTLNGSDQYTVFAPTDAAFEALYDALSDPQANPPVIVDEITDLPVELVTDVLLYHVTNGRRAANSVVPKTGSRQIMTLLGEKFTVDNELKITAIGNTANISPELNNVSASNGIIHVIDAVILPIVP